MGPGLWYDEADHRVHIRLAPTSNQVDDLDEYEGPADPRQLRLALSRISALPLWVYGRATRASRVSTSATAARTR